MTKLLAVESLTALYSYRSRTLSVSAHADHFDVW
jgi:hypothetical protein